MFLKISSGLGLWAAMSVALTVLAAGCGKHAGKPALTPVSGVVLLDGKPLADAKLTFYLTGCSAPGFSASTGTTDASGKYQLNSRGRPGAVAGVFKVTISRVVSANGAAVKPDEGMDLQQLAMQGLAQESLPAEFSNFDRSTLTVTVEPGKTEGYDFNL